MQGPRSTFRSVLVDLCSGPGAGEEWGADACSRRLSCAVTHDGVMIRPAGVGLVGMVERREALDLTLPTAVVAKLCTSLWYCASLCDADAAG